MATPTQLAYRSLKGIDVVQTSPVYQRLPGFQKPEGNVRCCIYSLCGSFLAWASTTSITIIDASVGSVVGRIAIENIFDLAFSPLGTYLSAWQRPSKTESGDATKNARIWRTRREPSDDEVELAGQFVQKTANGWALQYTADETICARAVSNEVQIYRSRDLQSVWKKAHIDGIADFKVAPGKEHRLAAFIPERKVGSDSNIPAIFFADQVKGMPAMAKIYSVANLDTPTSQKSFFKGDKVQFKWNSTGTSLIVLAQTEVDKSGKSYYGETTLYLMSATGDFDSRIDLDKEGPIHDVSWSPTGKSFGVVYGYMPAKTSIFNLKATCIHTFPLGPRNTIAYSPHGRYLLVAGFGNLAGQMDIYDLEQNYAKVTTVEASNASVCEWSPDGRHILIATTSPRLRVDNGVRIFHVGGSLMYNENLEELYQVSWRPQSTAIHPIQSLSDPAPVPHESASAYLVSCKTPSKAAGAYRPPGARGQVTPLAFRREDEGGEAIISNGNSHYSPGVITFGRSKKREIPGAETVSSSSKGPANQQSDEGKASKSAAKNKKKREARKTKDSKDQEAATPPVVATPAEPSPLAQDPAVLNKMAPAELAQDSENGQPSQDKRARALLKKLRAIEELKMRRAGGEKLEGTQIKKMETEESVRQELASIGISE